VAHTYNLSYSGGRDQEDRDLRPVPVKSFKTPLSQAIKIWAW
jgi:hypothetical protein